jgi:hypothetical protein
MCKEMPVIPANRAVDKKIIIGINGGPRRRRRGTRGMEKVGKFYRYLVYITTIWYNLWLFGNLCSGNLVYFPPFWYIVSQKIWQPCFKS